MMKKISLFALAAVSAFVVANAGVKVTKNSVETDRLKVNVYSGGEIMVSSVKEKDAFSSMYLSIGTKGGYFSFRSKKAKRKFDNDEKGVWKISGIFPADKKEATLNAEEVIELTQMNALDIDCSWNTPDMKNASDIGFFVRFKMPQVAGKEFCINGKGIKIENITKYGWFRAVYDEANVVFCKGDPKHEFSIICGKCSIIIESSKDKSVAVRFYPQSRTDGKLQMTLDLFSGTK